MRFINSTDPQGPVSLADVLAQFQGICLPPEASLIDFEALGFAQIDEGTAPIYDEATQSMAPGPVSLIDGTWTQTYVVTELSSDAKAANVAAALDRAFNSVQDAVQSFMNIKAAERRYDSIQSAALRAGYPGPYHDEGVAYGTWMDACWSHCYAVMADVQASSRPVPSSDQMIAELPALALPDRAA
jgi:hypothetical protein